MRGLDIRGYRHPMADFVRAVATADIPDDKGRLWRHGDKRIALFRTPAGVYAADNRHPGLVIENCASGGLRTDYALLSRMQLSGSRRSPRRRPPPSRRSRPPYGPTRSPRSPRTRSRSRWPARCSGRIHLSGHLDRMSPGQRALVAEGVRAYKRVRAEIA